MKVVLSELVGLKLRAVGPVRPSSRPPSKVSAVSVILAAWPGAPMASRDAEEPGICLGGNAWSYLHDFPTSHFCGFPLLPQWCHHEAWGQKSALSAIPPTPREIAPPSQVGRLNPTPPPLLSTTHRSALSATDLGQGSKRIEIEKDSSH